MLTPVSRQAAGEPPEIGSLAPFFAFAFAAYPLGAVAAQISGIDNRALAWFTRGGAFGLTVFVAFMAIRGRRLFAGTRTFWFAFCLFWGVYSVRLLWDVVITDHPLIYTRSVYLSFTFCTCVAPMFAAMVRTTTVERESIRIWLTRSLVLVCLGAIVAEVTGLKNGQVLLDVEGGRFGSATLNPIEIGQLGAILASLATASILANRAHTVVLRAIGSLALGLSVMLASASRGPVLSLIVSLSALLFIRILHSGSIRASRLITVVLIVGAIGVASAEYLENTVGFSTVSRIASLFGGGSDESSAARIRVVRRAVAGFEDSPVVGYALEEYSSRNYPHNVILDSLMAVGLLGTVPLLALLFGGFRAAGQLMARAGNDVWIGLLFLQLATEAMISGNVWGSGTMWVALAAAVAAVGPHPMRVRAPLNTPLAP